MTTDRKFSIADGLVLIAGIAAGMALVRLANPDVTAAHVWNAFTRPEGGWTFVNVIELGVESSVEFAVPIVAAWTPVCLLIQVPRTRWRRLKRQPGFVACAIASSLTLATIALCVLLSAGPLWNSRGAGLGYELVRTFGGLIPGSGVLSSWATMSLCGACRPVASWPDRLGRVTGAVWVAMGAMCGLGLTFV